MPPLPFAAITSCADDVTRWFLENGMLLNPAKTEAVLFGTHVQQKKIDTASGITVAGAQIDFSDSVKLLGIHLDSTISLDRHVTEVVRSCSFHARALRHIRPLLNRQTAMMVAQGIVPARLDYCNSLLYGTSASNLDRLQVAQNALAGLSARLRGLRVPLNSVARCTGCQYDNESNTS